MYNPMRPSLVANRVKPLRIRLLANATRKSRLLMNRLFMSSKRTLSSQPQRTDPTFPRSIILFVRHTNVLIQLHLLCKTLSALVATKRPRLVHSNPVSIQIRLQPERRPTYIAHEFLYAFVHRLDVTLFVSSFAKQRPTYLTLHTATSRLCVFMLPDRCICGSCSLYSASC